MTLHVTINSWKRTCGVNPRDPIILGKERAG